MPKFIDITGHKYGELTVLSRSISGPRRTLWLCKCSCGNECFVRGDQMKSGHTVSCGCVSKKRLAEHREKHGKHLTRSYRIWIGIKKRCLNKSSKAYSNYGGRGISICDEWMHFENFYKDMGDPPKGTSIDRIDVNGNYCKENCRWATDKEQASNKRNSIRIEFNGEQKTIEELAMILGMKENTLYCRLIVYKWPIEKAINKPVAPHVYEGTCEICGEKHFAKKLCKIHYDRMYKLKNAMKLEQSA